MSLLARATHGFVCLGIETTVLVPQIVQNLVGQIEEEEVVGSTLLEEEVLAGAVVEEETPIGQGLETEEEMVAELIVEEEIIGVLKE